MHTVSATRSRAAGLAATCAALAAAPAAGAAATTVSTLPTTTTPRVTELAPGVSYERVAGADGRVVHVVRTRPRAAGLVPFLPGGSVGSTGSLLDASNARAATVVAAVNADFFNLQSAYPSGMTVIDNRLMSEPEPSRSALVIGADGTLSSGRFTLLGSWQVIAPDGTPVGALRRFPGINRPAERPSEMLVYTPDYGRATPEGASRNEAVVRLDQDAPGLAAVGSVTGTVVATSAGGGTTVPANAVVITGVGASRAIVAGDLATGQRVRIDTLTGGFPAGAQAVGGGPLLVDGGAAVPAAGEGFSVAQTDQRTSRTAVGQLADGGYILMTVEGPGQGGSGVTVAEQAQIAAGQGARLAVAMDAGGSSQMVVDGWPVMNWSSPRPVTTAVAMTYNGVRVAPVIPRVTPNGDRVDDTAAATITAPSAGVLSVAMVRRGGATALLRQRVDAGRTALTVDPARSGISDGPYRLAAEFTPDDGSAPTTASRDVVVDRTLGRLGVRAFQLRAGRSRPRPSLAIGFRLSRPARVTVRVENASGVPVRVLRSAKVFRKGDNRVVWDRMVGRRRAEGRVRVVVITRSSGGTSGLVATTDLPRPTPVRAPKRPAKP